MLEITSAVPMTGRPSGWLPNDRLGDQVVHRLLRRILVHRNLLEDDLALRVEVDERRREHHVRHDVERRLDVLVHDPCVDDRVLTRRGCVQLAAETVEDLGDLLGRIGARALEQQVFEEVAGACLRGVLVAGAGIDPEADRG